MSKSVVIKTNSLYAVIFILTASSAHAGIFDTVSPTSASQKIINFIVSKVSEWDAEGKMAQMLCKKASFADKSFSVRSFSGVACKVGIIAAVAEAVCRVDGDPYEFNGSGCDKNAMSALKISTFDRKDPAAIEAKAEAQIIKVLESKSDYQKFACKIKDAFPEGLKNRENIWEKCS